MNRLGYKGPKESKEPKSSQIPIMPQPSSTGIMHPIHIYHAATKDDSWLSAVLCYVEPPWAYFTTQKLGDQWGDDWDDRPYENNAGEPYIWTERHSNPPAYEVHKVAYDSDWLITPAEDNMVRSVEEINKGDTPWLKTSKYYSENHVSIYAGTTLSDFIKLLQFAGGRVYLEQEAENEQIAS